MKWLGKTIILSFFLLAVLLDTLSVARAEETLSEEDSLIVQLMVNRSATEDNIEVYQHEGGFLVPLGYLSQIIDFAIKLDIDAGQAYGWFIRENRNFLLDINKKIVVVAGKETPLDSRKIVMKSDDIYVDSSLFSEWFPIDLELDFSRLILRLKPREKLPFQEKMERDKSHGKLSRTTKKQNNYPRVVTKPKMLSIPFINFDIGNQYDSSSKPANTMSYNMLAQGDVAGLSTNTYLSGDSDESLTGLRVKAGNRDNEGKLFGFMHATEYSLGDINSVSLPLITSAGRGRGVYISSFDLKRPDQFDQTSFVGDSQPGWEVELYRNGELLEFQVVGDDGRYEFKNIPILYGNNNFKIISYGPQGQVHEEVKNYSIDDSILNKGKFGYRFSADERSQTLFGIDEKLTTIRHDKDIRFVGNVEYGLTDKVTATLGAISTPLEDHKLHNYHSIGLRTSFAGILASLNTAYDYENNGSAAQLAVNTSIKDVNTRLEHIIFDNFVSEEELATNDLRESTSKLDLNGRISALIASGISYSFGVKQEKYVNDREVMTYSNRLSTTIYGIGFGNDIQAVDTTTRNFTTSIQTGNFSIRGKYKDIFVRLSTDYNIAPESTIRSLNLSLQKNLKNKVNIRSDIRKDLGDSSLTTVNLGLTKEFKNYRLSALASADTDSHYTVGVRMSFSLGRDSANKEWFIENKDIASSGAVSAQAFIDNNYNGEYDDEDELIASPVLKIAGRSGYYVQNAEKKEQKNQKVAIVTGVEPFFPVDVELDTGSLEDPFLTPVVKGYSLITRPGVITTVTFPVTYTTEIDGTIYKKKDGETKPIPHMEVELVSREDDRVVNTTRSEYDGFYILSEVVPGDYYIRISKESLKSVHAASSQEVDINIPSKSDFISGMDIVVTSR